ncbi:MAG: hypothetical protein NVS3B18_08460 [Candidatus Dormibacteria bacterium]
MEPCLILRDSPAAQTAGCAQEWHASRVTDSTPRPADRPAPDRPDDGILERAMDAIRDRVRSVELGLLEGDHTPVGEFSGVFEELVHPQGEEDPAPERHGDPPER